MSDQLQKPGRPDSDDIARARLVPQLGMMLEAFWASPLRNTLLWLAGAVFLVIVATAYGQIRLNRWNEPFYDALARLPDADRARFEADLDTALDAARTTRDLRPLAHAVEALELEIPAEAENKADVPAPLPLVAVVVDRT